MQGRGFITFWACGGDLAARCVRAAATGDRISQRLIA
jgi:hypothetical protein